MPDFPLPPSTGNHLIVNGSHLGIHQHSTHSHQGLDLLLSVPVPRGVLVVVLECQVRWRRLASELSGQRARVGVGREGENMVEQRRRGMVSGIKGKEGLVGDADAVARVYTGMLVEFDIPY